MIKNIVFFIQNFSRAAGSERVTSIIANELVKRDFNVSILSICGDNSCFYEIDKRVKLYTLFRVPEINNRKKFLSVVDKLACFYKRTSVDLVVDVFAALSIYTIILKPRFKYMNITWEHFNFLINTGMNKIGRRMAIKFSDKIITLTKIDKKRYIENGTNKKKIENIYNPSPFQHVILNLEKKKWLISVGRLCYQKGFDRLLKIWKIVESQSDWELLIIGDGEERKALEKEIHDLKIKKIHLLGNVKTIDEYYKKARVYISTARFEGLPMTMIEAQSYGLPIISFDYDTGPKEIIRDGIDGVIIPRQEENIMIKNCATELIFMLENSYVLDSYSKEAFKSANRFKLKKILPKWEKLIDGLNSYT